VLNQLGFYPESDVQFSVIVHSQIRDTLTAKEEHKAPGPAYFITNLSGDEIVRTGKLAPALDWSRVGGVRAHHVNEGPLPTGEYRIYVPGLGYSTDFMVKEGLYQEAFIASLKSDYYQRAGEELLPQHAGMYARPAGHPDTSDLFHPSSCRSGITRSPGGWYDAGDFNKYIVNAAFPLAQYLALFEDIGDPIPDGGLNIPESGNGRSDYLDELKVELDWMLTMQDKDGGLFHKLTTLKFEGMVMPHEATNQRYVVGKGTAATLDFAGATAMAARIFRSVDEAYSNQLLLAAERAWKWAEEHPDVAFTNPADVNTGQYGDKNFADERTFVAAELFLTTDAPVYLEWLEANLPPVGYREGGSWTAFMGQLAVFSLLRNRQSIPEGMQTKLTERLVGVADSLIGAIDTSAFRQPVNRFVWGSTSDVLNGAMVLIAAHQQRPEAEYIAGVKASVDYIFGHNPLGYSYVTGFGDRTPMFIHHRACVADGFQNKVDLIKQIVCFKMSLYLFLF